MPWWYADVTKLSGAEMCAVLGAEKGTARAEAGDASSGAASAVASIPEVAVDGGFSIRVWSRLTPIAPLHCTRMLAGRGAQCRGRSGRRAAL